MQQEMAHRTVKMNEPAVFREKINAALRRAIASGNGRLAKALAATLLRHPVPTGTSA